MASKTVWVGEVGEVQFTKRRANRSIRINLTPTGEVKVSLPTWVSFAAAVAFVESKTEWIAEHRPARVRLLQTGDRIGKAHQLAFEAVASLPSISTKVLGNQVRITYPPRYTQNHISVQTAARRAAIRALRRQGVQLLPVRLDLLAQQHGFTYRSARIKQLTRRWGSCTNQGDIVLNLFLMQLPWELIDYVLLHELIHTKVLNHGTDFWKLFEQCLPGAKQLKKRLHRYQPIIQANDFFFNSEAARD